MHFDSWSRFEQFPTLIAYVKDAAEVAPLIRCAQSGGIKTVPRNGGHQLSLPFHSYIDGCTTLLLLYFPAM